ncbi:MAG: thioredoxin family protein [Gammaproteobacteria bacterium]|nr:thioredoxin family protein [Gammaproteobacteria bacterium]
MRWLVLLLCLSVQTVMAADQNFFDESLGDFSEELALAREQGKKGILLFFEMDECPFCHRMKTTILNQPEVIAYFKKHFLIFPVDIEGDIEISDFQGKSITQKDFAFKEHRVRATPVMAFFDLNGQIVARYTGATSTVEEFMWLGEYVVTEAYKVTSFNRFKRDKRKTSE